MALAETPFLEEDLGLAPAPVPPAVPANGRILDPGFNLTLRPMR